MHVILMILWIYVSILKYQMIGLQYPLVPVNPSKWGSHAAGSILSQKTETADARGLLVKPFDNLVTAGKYIADGHNSSHTASRVKEVLVDTVRVNGLSEMGGIPGTTCSGVYANWAADKYELKMKSDLEQLPSNSSKAYTESKKKIRENAQKKEKPTAKVLAEMNPKIGNAPSSPTVTEFGRNNSRSLWTRKFFNRGGAQTFVIEIPTNQTYLYNKQQVVDYNDCMDGSTIIKRVKKRAQHSTS